MTNEQLDTYLSNARKSGDWDKAITTLAEPLVKEKKRQNTREVLAIVGVITAFVLVDYIVFSFFI